MDMFHENVTHIGPYFDTFSFNLVSIPSGSNGNLETFILTKV